MLAAMDNIARQAAEAEWQPRSEIEQGSNNGGNAAKN